MIEQYQFEEQTAMAYRAFAARKQLLKLLSIMIKDEIPEYHKIKMLKEELNSHFNMAIFKNAAPWAPL